MAQWLPQLMLPVDYYIHCKYMYTRSCLVYGICVLSLVKTLYSHSASLHPGEMGTIELLTEWATKDSACVTWIYPPPPLISALPPYPTPFPIDQWELQFQSKWWVCDVVKLHNCIGGRPLHNFTTIFYYILLL